MHAHPESLVVALALAALAPAATSQSAPETFGLGDPTPARAPKAELPPYSVRFGLNLPADMPAYTLNPIDEGATFAQDDQDAALGGGKVVRYGLARSLSMQPTDGVWHDLSDGRWLWTADIVSMNAVGIRLHVANIAMPIGAEMMVYAPADTTRIAGPYELTGPHDTGSFWTPTRPGERVRIEYFVEGAPPATPPFTIDALQHIYRDPTRIPQPEGAGNCHNDVTCAGAYSNLKQACAGIGFINSNALYCSGQMLNSQAGDLTPYFMTANHCVSTSTDALDSEIYWNYQTSVCNGAPPSLASVPTSAGCSLLSTGVSSDYTLLMINGTIPSGLYWAGWTAGVTSSGTPGACIHHPGGSYKRISYGTYSSTLDCGGADHFRVNWTNGPTEPGSSGSGFFRSDTQQFVGQLHCGPSACGNETTDQYGRFADTYPSVAGFLAGGSDDGFEPNDSCGGLPDITEGTHGTMVVKANDDDWYEIVVPSGGQLTVTLNFTHGNGDIDTQLWVNCADSTYTDISNGVGNTEVLTWVNPGGANTVAWRVYLYNDTRNTYSMNVSLTPPNNTCANAVVVSDNIWYAGTTVDATNSDSASCGNSATAPDVWYEYVAAQTGLLQIQTTDSQLDTVITVYDACFGAELACNDDAGAGSPVNYGTLHSYLSVPVLSGQDYFIRVAGYSGLQDNFRIRFDTDTGAPLCLGDGISGNNCPCLNFSPTASEAGCRNSTGNDGRLAASGTSDVSSDSVVLVGSGMPPGSTVLFFQGTGKVSAGAGAVFGDGLRCVTGSVIRLGTKSNSAGGTANYPTGAEADVSVRGNIPAGGGTRYYQAWYRNAAAYCTAITFNLTNAYELSWQP